MDISTYGGSEHNKASYLMARAFSLVLLLSRGSSAARLASQHRLSRAPRSPGTARGPRPSPTWVSSPRCYGLGAGWT